MARISRALQKIFGGSASNIGDFGSAAAGSPVSGASPTLAAVQSLAQFVNGWSAATLGASKFPALEDMNALDYLFSTQIAYLLQQGIAEYDATTTYYQKNIVCKAGTYQLYGSVTDNNTGNALTDVVNWVLLVDLANIVTSNVFTGGTSTGSANSQVVTPLSPTGFSLSSNGATVICTAGYTNSGATQFNLGGTGLTDVKKDSGSGLVALSGGEIHAGDTIFLTVNTAGSCLVLTAGLSLGTLAYLNIGNGCYNDGSGALAINVQAHVNEFRLSLTTGLPVTTADVTAATTLYCTPYKGNSIALYSGTAWLLYTSAEFSIALGTLTSGKNYDVFCYDNAGTPTLELLVWTNDSTRATALAYQNGVLVKSGATTRRYLGTIRTTSTTTTEDSFAKRFLYNYNNRVVRPLLKQDATASWTYTAAAYQQANASTANQVEAIQGVAEDAVEMQVLGLASCTSPNVAIAVGIGVDSTTVNSAQNGGGETLNGDIKTDYIASYKAIPAVGYHKYCWLEYGGSTGGTTTWYGTSAPLLASISGLVMA